MIRFSVLLLADYSIIWFATYRFSGVLVRFLSLSLSRRRSSCSRRLSTSRDLDFCFFSLSFERLRSFRDFSGRSFSATFRSRERVLSFFRSSRSRSFDRRRSFFDFSSFFDSLSLWRLSLERLRLRCLK